MKRSNRADVEYYLLLNKTVNTVYLHRNDLYEFIRLWLLFSGLQTRCKIDEDLLRSVGGCDLKLPEKFEIFCMVSGLFFQLLSSNLHRFFSFYLAHGKFQR